MQKLLVLLSFLPCFLFATIPSGYNDGIEGLHTDQLITALHIIICNDTTGYLSYGPGKGRTWEGFYTTDRKLSDNSLIDMYSSEIRYFPDPNPYFSSFGTTVQLEHSLPKSWWGGYEWAAYKDLFHLYPSNGEANNAKSNYPLGVVTGSVIFTNGVSKVGVGVYSGYSGNVFEPADEYKGDFARSYMYMATAYQNYVNYWNSPMLDNNTYPVFNTWAKDLLLAWHRNDPVSDKETTRNEAVSGFQHNRNPFIDYPQLAEYIWGNNTGTPFSFITGTINVTGKILANQTKLSFTTNQTRMINIKGADLQGVISVSLTGTNAGMFTVSTNSISIENAGGYGTEVSIQYVPTNSGTHTATLTISSPNATKMIFPLEGKN